MSKKLSDANVYLRDPAGRASSVRRSVATSSAVEGIRRPFASNHAASSEARTTVAADKVTRRR